MTLGDPEHNWSVLLLIAVVSEHWCRKGGWYQDNPLASLNLPPLPPSHDAGTKQEITRFMRAKEMETESDELGPEEEVTPQRKRRKTNTEHAKQRYMKLVYSGLRTGTQPTICSREVV